MMIGKKFLAIFRSVPIFAMAYSKKVCRLFNNKKKSTFYHTQVVSLWVSAEHDIISLVSFDSVLVIRIRQSRNRIAKN